MVLSYDFSDELKVILKKLFKKDKRRYEILMKKIDNILSFNENEIGHFKNLRHDLKDEKRVHVDKSFVLTFKYIKEKNFILFLDYDHHDNIYKK